MDLTNDEIWMQRCFDLAEMAGLEVKSNPCVGALLVCKEKVIGEGYHVNYGQSHAEIMAINSVSLTDRHLIQHSTLYVSLEPCSHFGKTPPCVHRILEEKIPKVVYGITDPNPQVNGNGVRFLKGKGITVIGPVLLKRAQKVISPFVANQKGLPYVVLKWAASSDGFISESGKQTWLTNPLTQTITHKWRSESDAIMIGKNTAVIDNPSLTVRSYFGKNPIRIVFDSTLSLSGTENVLTDKNETWLINKVKNSAERNVQFIHVTDTREIYEVLNFLYVKGIHKILVEGGTTLINSFIQGGGWHEARIIATPVKLGSGLRAPSLTGKLERSLKIGDNTVYYISNQNAL